MDESSDTSDTAQRSIIIRVVDSSLCVTEELLGLKSMHGTITGKDIFEEVFKFITKMSLPWDKLVGQTTDVAPAMCGQKSALVGRVQEKMQVSLQFITVSSMRKRCMAKLCKWNML